MESNNDIVLTLDPFGEKIAETAKKAQNADNSQEQSLQLQKLQEMTNAGLSEKEKETVAQFAQQIDINDATLTLQYGAGTQQKIAEFSDQALKSVKTQDLGETGNMIAELVGELKVFSDDIENSGKKTFFKRAKKNLTVLKAKYDKVENSVGSIVSTLDRHLVSLLKDIAVLDELYNTNLTHFKELSMYILAGKQKLETEKATTLLQLENQAKASGLPEDAQKANDFSAKCERFEKKIHDLELTRMISIQMAPQIRLVQNNDTMMSEKIQSTIVNTIPLWKSQMLIAMGLAHSEDALKAERAVTDMTNELLKRNAELLHQSTVEIAKESERGIVDIETLAHTNQELIATLDEVFDIQKQGHDKRIAAEAELGRIEGELKDKLMQYMRK